MKRYVCIDCGRERRTRNPNVGRCLQCANALGFGSSNRPNRKALAVTKARGLIKAEFQLGRRDAEK